MGAILYGEFTRIRWCGLEADDLTSARASVRTAVNADALLSSGATEEAWGLSPGQCVLLAGHDVVGTSEENVVRLSRRPSGQPKGLPSAGVWLVGVQRSAHCWGALRRVSGLSRSELTISWCRLDMAGAGELYLGSPMWGNVPFLLIYPPAQDGERQAILTPGIHPVSIADLQFDSADDDALPFAVADGSAGGDQAGALAISWQRARPKYRYGILSDGLLRWLDLPAGEPPQQVSPMTRRFREKLADLAQELARRGVHYQDDEDGYNYELVHALEDAVVPPDFGSPDAPLARSVSSYYDLADKVDQAEELFDPERDNEDWLTSVVDYRRMPSRIDVISTDIIFSGGELGDSSADADQVGAIIEVCAEAVGLQHSRRRRLVTVTLA